jgi:hypothetical protein
MLRTTARASGSEMSTRPKDVPSSAFATLRIVGDALEPSAVTRIVHLKPTFAHRKGQKISSDDGMRSRIGKFGIWYFSTRELIASPDLDEHFRFLAMNVLIDSKAPWEADIPLFDRDRLEVLLTVSRPNQRLRDLVQEQSLTLVITGFWRGRNKRGRPSIPEGFRSFLKLFSAKLEMDSAVQGIERAPPLRKRSA